MTFETDDLIQFADPRVNGAIVRGRFLEVAVNEPIEVPSPEGGFAFVDAAWVAREDGTTDRVRYTTITPASES